MIIFFDLDDTLMDHSRAVRGAAIALHADLRVGGTNEEFVGAWREAQRRHYPRFLTGELSYETVRRLRVRETVSAELGDDEADELFAEYMRIYQSQWMLFPDVLPCLDRLRDSGFAVGVISNGPSVEQRAKLRALVIEGRFQHILISEECGFAKPDRQIFQRACETAGVPPQDVVHVGDHYEVDVCGSRNAGLRAIWLNRLGCQRGPTDDEVIESLSELPAIL
ncbi:MAG TPA: HAD family hydrolase [Planctomycetaceae bacterium]|nr:HAD family hydrolase [Planctomycetaceae bacterium]